LIEFLIVFHHESESGAWLIKTYLPPANGAVTAEGVAPPAGLGASADFLPPHAVKVAAARIAADHVNFFSAFIFVSYGKF
jgi:hypothetical protein